MTRTISFAAGLLVFSTVALSARGPGYDPRITKDGWEILFDGTNLNAWEYNSSAWQITRDHELYRAAGGGDIWSKQRYCDYVLDLEFKVAAGTNSGVFVRTHSKREWLHTGMEVQILDSSHEKNPGIHDTGAVYDIQAPSKNAMQPPGKWNRYTITVDENLITIVLNGETVNVVDLDKWTEAHQNPDGSRNKFNYAYKDMIREGFIAFQDHGNPVWYRNVRIKPLGTRQPRYTGTERYEDIVDEERKRQLESMRQRELAQKARTSRSSTRLSPPPTPARDPSEVEAERLYKMARQAERMGQRSAAQSLYRKIVAKYEQTSFVEKAAERLKKLGR